MLVNNCVESTNAYNHYLHYLGLSVETVKTVQEALTRLKETSTNKDSIKLILSDIQLPGVDPLIIDYPLITTVPFASALTNEATTSKSTHYLLETPVNIKSLLGAISSVLNIENTYLNIPSIAHNDDKNAFKSLVNRIILLAEDDLTNQEITQAILSKVGIKVDIVNNGQEAINALQQRQYDAVLMDIEMPILNGYQATQQIRSDMRFDQMPIIGITARALPGDAEKALATGMNSYITKPINQQTLLKKLTQLLKDSPILVHGIVAEQNSVENVFHSTPPHSDLSQMQQLIDQEITGLDLKQAMQLAELGLAAFQKVLKTYYQSNLDVIDDLYNIYHQQNWKALKQLAHRIYGSAAHIGATNLKKEAEQIESICTEPMNFVPDEHRVDRFSHELKHIQFSLSSLIKPQPLAGQEMLDVPSNGVEFEAILRSIKKLNSALEDSEPSKVKKHFTKLLTYIGAKKTDELNDKIRKFNYHEAQYELKKIKAGLEENRNNIK